MQPGLFQDAPGLLRVGRFLAQAAHFLFHPHAPGIVQRAVSANRAGPVTVGGMHRQREFEQIGELLRAAGVGGGRGALRFDSRAQLGHSSGHFVGFRRLQGLEPTQEGYLPFRRFERAFEHQLHIVERPRAGAWLPDRRRAGARAIVVESRDPGEPLLPNGLRGGALLLLRKSPGAQSVAGVDQGVEPQRGREHVVERRGLAVGDRPELVVRQERPIDRHRFRPAGRREAVTPARTADIGDTRFQGGAVLRPTATDDQWLRGSLDGEDGLHLRGAGPVQVAPTCPPDRGAGRPSAVAVRQEQFQRFGEARFAAAVSSHDQREPGSGRHPHLATGADAAEALDGQRLEVGLSRRRTDGSGGRWLPNGRDGGALRQCAIERLVSLESGKHQQPGSGVERAVGIGSRTDPRDQRGIAAGGSTGRWHTSMVLLEDFVHRQPESGKHVPAG